MTCPLRAQPDLALDALAEDDVEPHHRVPAVLGAHNCGLCCQETLPRQGPAERAECVAPSEKLVELSRGSKARPRFEIDGAKAEHLPAVRFESPPVCDVSERVDEP